MKIIEEHKCFNGVQRIYEHNSTITRCKMKFAVFVPPVVNKSNPLLYWLSGLTCNEQNFISKAGAQRIAAKNNIILVVPDTSPRNVAIQGDKDSYDFGVGAGFYVDATEKPWSDHYKMYSYIKDELPPVLESILPFNKNACGIFGHSMGGHGALILALRNPEQYKSVSAFAPIAAPINSPWGQKAFTGYLGNDQKSWREYDAAFLVETRGYQHGEILIDQGSDDEFLEEQLHPHLFSKACDKALVKLNLRMHKGYDHSYYFISTFIEDHIDFHANNLKLYTSSR